MTYQAVQILPESQVSLTFQANVSKIVMLSHHYLTIFSIYINMLQL